MNFALVPLILITVLSSHKIVSSSIPSSSSQVQSLMTPEQVTARIELNRELLGFAASHSRFCDVKEMTPEQRSLEVSTWYQDKSHYLITRQRFYDALFGLDWKGYNFKINHDLSNYFFPDEIKEVVESKTKKPFLNIDKDPIYLALKQKHFLSLGASPYHPALVASVIRSLENSILGHLVPFTTESFHLARLFGEPEISSDNQEYTSEVFCLSHHQQLLYELDQVFYKSNPSKLVLKARAESLKNYINTLCYEQEKIKDNKDIRFTQVPLFQPLARALSIEAIRQQNCKNWLS